jgi:hypothetical protein
LWTRDPGGDLSRAIFGLLVEARVASFILTLTNRRVIVHLGHNFDARRSKMLGSYPRDQVSVAADDPPAKPRHLTVRFGQEKMLASPSSPRGGSRPSSLRRRWPRAAPSDCSRDVTRPWRGSRTSQRQPSRAGPGVIPAVRIRGLRTTLSEQRCRARL